MKLILLKDIPGIGRRNAIVDVNDGYARNFLLPKRFAEVATDKAISTLKNILQIAQNQNDVEQTLLMKNLSDLHNSILTVEEKANEGGHLFKGLNAEYIRDALMKNLRINVEAKYILLDKPIKSTGEYIIPVDIGGNKTTFKMLVQIKK